ncbi:peptidoglycan-binding domain-containing protein [Abyssisolibacter fermentans]
MYMNMRFKRKYVDGIYGDGMKRCVIKFRKDKGLKRLVI